MHPEIRDLPVLAAAAPQPLLDDVAALAAELSGKALLPVIGAGGSFACLVRLAGDLADGLWAAIDDGSIAMLSLPSDAAKLRADRDLGAVADVIHLEHPPETTIEALGFADRKVWPGPLDVVGLHDTSPHECAYRVLARMARERLIGESVTFNYDCHFEGSLLREGFQFRTPGGSHASWPDRFDVVADKESHTSLEARGDFVLQKVHGCAETWRARRAANLREASEAIVIRWSQLLDWRHDFWARDLFRDRARRHILLLIGFGGEDAVIHSALAEVMREVTVIRPGPTSRVRVLDRHPEKLRLRMLVEAGGGTSTVRSIPVGNGNPVLAQVLLLLLSELVRLKLQSYATSAGETLRLPASRRSQILRITASGPAMMRWTYGIALAARGGVTGVLATMDERGDEYYAPLTTEPSRALRAFETREELAAMLGVDPDGEDSLPDGAIRRSVDVRAWVPLGLLEHELDSLEQADVLAQVAERLVEIPDLKYAVVAKTPDGLRARSVDTGHEVDISP